MNPRTGIERDADAASEAVHPRTDICSSASRLLLLILQPIVDLLGDCVFADAECFRLAFKLIALAGNSVEIVIGKMTPLLLDLALELLPVSFACDFQSIVLLTVRAGQRLNVAAPG